jgi:hypothetical protein
VRILWATVVIGSVVAAGKPGDANGQERRVYFSAYAGLALSRLSFNEDDFVLTFGDPLVGEIALENKFQPGFVGGISMVYELVGPLAMEQGLEIGMHGGRLEGEGVLRVADATEVTVSARFQTIYRLTYVNVPILLRATHNRQRVRVYGAAGPEFAVMFTSRAEDEFEVGVGGFQPDTFIGDFDVEDFTHRVDFRARFVVGVQIPREGYTGFLEARYGLGLAEVYEEPPTENSVVRNRVLAFVAGVFF